MKLHDLETLKTQDKAKKVLESRLEQRLPLEQLTARQARSMLQRVQGLIAEHRATPAFHSSERNPAYLRLIMMEQGLSAHVAEQDTGVFMMPVDTKDPKVQQTLKKAQGGQTLTPDEQKMVTAMATQQKESSKKPRRLVKESEIQQAQVVLAAQDMVDRIQGMIEDISEMQFKDLPALADSVKNDMGTEQASQFQSSAAAALSQLLSSIQEGKTQLESAQGVLTGQAPVVPGADAMAGDMAAPGDDLIGGDSDVIEPPRDDQDDDEDDDAGAALGRERR
jgi:hypothetical protein